MWKKILEVLKNGLREIGQTLSRHTVQPSAKIVQDQHENFLGKKEKEGIFVEGPRTYPDSLSSLAQSPSHVVHPFHTRSSREVVSWSTRQQ